MQLTAGFAIKDITPEISELKPVWIAGYKNGRAATSVADRLFAVAAVLSLKGQTLAIVSLDSIGLGFDDLAVIRESLRGTVDEVVVASTHSHQTPDVIGIWGKNLESPGWDQGYIDLIVKQSVAAVKLAKSQLKPAQLNYGHLPFPLEEHLMQDSRPPHVKDPGIHVLQFKNESIVLGQIVIWSNHPEAMGAENTALSPDYPATLRDKLNPSPTLFLVGAIGGLLSPESFKPIPTPDGRWITQPGKERAVAVGEQLAMRIQQGLEKELQVLTVNKISFKQQEIFIPIENVRFKEAIKHGLIRGHTIKDGKIKSRVSVMAFGDLNLLGIPGEIYPEIIWGGIPRSKFTDYPSAPREEPAVKDWFKNRKFAVIGLADDELGYLIPKSSWDTKAPNFLGEPKLFYGEENAVGSDAGSIVYQALRKLVLENP